MAFPSAPSVFRSISLLTVLFAAAAHGDTVFDEDPLQPVTSDETVSAGGTVTLTCRVAENDNSSLQWSNTAQQTLYFGEKRALRDNRIQLHRSTPTELSITISDVQLSDEGEYTCSLFTMPVRTARATVTVLGVPSKPQLSGFEVPVMEGTSVTLTCSSTGSKPPAKLRWYREDQELPGGSDTVESDSGDLTFKVSSVLTLEVSRNDDNSFITCAVDHATLTSGNKKSAQALRVLYSPNVQILPSSDLPREGERFNLQCLGNSNPEPRSYIWEKKDGELPPMAKVDGAFLHFEMLNKSDNGVYLCLAENGIGNSEEEYILRVQDPMVPESVDATSPSLDYFTHPTLLPSSSSSFSSSSLGSDPSSISSSGYDITSSSSSSGSDPTSISSTGSDTTSSSSLTEFTSTSTSTSSLDSASSLTGMGTTLYEFSTATLSNVLFPDIPLLPDFISTPPTPSASTATPSSSRSAVTITPSVSIRLNGVYTFTDAADYIADPTAMSSPSGVDHAVVGGVVAVIVFILLCLLIIFGRYLIRHKGTYLTHEAKGSDDAPDADTAIINAEGGTSGGDDKKEYFI